MSMIKIEHLTFSYPGSYDNVFEDAGFQIDSGWRLGLVGRNGRGKTTLFRLLRGEYAYSGEITSTVEFAGFPYPVRDPEALTREVLEEICPEAEDWRLLRELSLLEVEEGALWRPFSTLSNGERTKVLLSALFLGEERFLLIDEPTNHLDARARALVSAYLRRQKGFILVSHDRRFLDGCVDHILAINRADIQVRSGNFSAYMEDFRQRQAAEEAQNERLRRDIGRLKQSARRAAGWSDKVEASKIGAYDKGYVGHKSAKMMKRAKAIEARRQQAAEEKAQLLKNAESAEDLKLSPLDHWADILAAFTDVSASYGGRAVNRPVTFQVRRGDRVALTGRNGSGKTTLLKLLLGEDLTHTGTVALASGLVISYVPQDAAGLTGSLTAFAEAGGVEESLFKAVLRKMDFARVQFEKDLGELSAGQRKKALLARSLCQRAHLYVWDEPLNYIDVYSRMQLERLIARFSPTMVFVEHDQAFCESVATKTVEV